MVELQKYIDELRKAAKTNQLSYSVMMLPIEKLTSPSERRDYFNAYVELTKKSVQNDFAKGIDSTACKQLKEGNSQI